MKHPIFLTVLIVAPIMIGAVAYDQRDRIFPADPGPLIRPVDEVLDGSWNLEKLGGAVADPREAPPAPVPRPPSYDPAVTPPIPLVPTLYYGETCPACKKILAYVQDNRIAEKTGLREKDVFRNQDDAKEAVRAADSCGIPDSDMAVPFLFVGGQCLIGEKDVMAALESMARDE